MKASTFILVREDRGLDPTQIAVEGLKLGRGPECELLLNHPTVSRLHAGIKEIGGRFYLFNLSASNSTTLNGRVIATEEAEVLASGDEVRVGPFFLLMDRQGEALKITVSMQIGLRIGEDARGEWIAAQPVARPIASPALKEFAQALDLFWNKRTREKAGRKSPLHPRRPPRLGKARFNWTPTRDLVRPWPFAVFVWAVIVLIPLSIGAAFFYASAYAPEPVSNAHSRATFALSAAIAKRPNANSCLTCHSVTGHMESNCEACHTTEIFVSTVTHEHTEAGIGCLKCHSAPLPGSQVLTSEHHGKDFRPMQAALDSCTRCHNDQNKNTYNGRTVSTPHGGTFGYPKVNGEWKWKGLEPEELADRPQLETLRKEMAKDYDLTKEADKHKEQQQWINMQFHAMHLYRLQARGNVSGNSDSNPELMQKLPCATCHQLTGAGPVDRETPRKQCSTCHSGMSDALGHTLVEAGKPNCVSCHVQHAKDKRQVIPKVLIERVKSAAGETVTDTQ